MNVLVLGATGMAGHVIAIHLKEVGYNVTAFSRSNFAYCNNIIGDVLDFPFIERVVLEGNYDAVINAVGILNQDASDCKARAILLNSYLPHYLSDIAFNLRTRVIHMSTDCVFSGKTGRYMETSMRDGESFYDRTKALGELENDKDLTFRNSIIGPDLSENGIGLFNWFMKQSGQINGYANALWSGVTTLTLAKAMSKAVEEGVTGLYHLVPGESISKYDLLKLFNKHIRDNKLAIEPIERPIIDKSLVNTRNDFSFVVPSYEQMVIEMREWMVAHETLYPHYFRRRQIIAD